MAAIEVDGSTERDGDAVAVRDRSPGVERSEAFEKTSDAETTVLTILEAPTRETTDANGRSAGTEAPSVVRTDGQGVPA